ncbi:MAG: hypothetical protein ABSE16_18755 [Verrucomicrobiota bacterium]|jgi:hypothetical protein
MNEKPSILTINGGSSGVRYGSRSNGCSCIRMNLIYTGGVPRYSTVGFHPMAKPPAPVQI